MIPDSWFLIRAWYLYIVKKIKSKWCNKSSKELFPKLYNWCIASKIYIHTDKRIFYSIWQLNQYYMILTELKRHDGKEG